METDRDTAPNFPEKITVTSLSVKCIQEDILHILFRLKAPGSLMDYLTMLVHKILKGSHNPLDIPPPWILIQPLFLCYTGIILSILLG